MSPTGSSLYVGDMDQPLSYATSYKYRVYAAGSSIAWHTHLHPSLTIVLGGSYEEAIGGRQGIETPDSVLVCLPSISDAQRGRAKDLPRTDRPFTVADIAMLLNVSRQASIAA